MAIDFCPFSSSEHPKKNRLDFYIPDNEDEPISKELITEPKAHLKSIEDTYREQESLLMQDKAKLESDKKNLEKLKSKAKKRDLINESL